MATTEISGMDIDQQEVGFPYRAISKLAIFAIALFVLALFGLIPGFEPVLSLSLVGAVCGLLAIRTIKAYPAEYTGIGLATAGVGLCGALLVGGIGLHTYIYLTEVPEGYQRVQFYELEREKGPDAPTEKAIEIDGKDVFLKGYIHPASGDGDLQTFVLVPDLGTCCYGGQPRSTSMIEVKLSGRKSTRYGMRKLKLAGKFEINRRVRSRDGIDNMLIYRLHADILK